MDNFPISNAFQIKPELDSILQSETVKGLISKVLNDTLLNKTYSTEGVKKWTKTISDDISRGLKESTKRYKSVVQVVILQKLGQGFKFNARCRWDAESDRQITDSFISDSMICVVTVFGLFAY